MTDNDTPPLVRNNITFSDEYTDGSNGGTNGSFKKGDGAPLKRAPSYARVWWKFKMRDDDDDDDV